MRITFVVSELRYSGGVRVVAEYANRMAERGHVVSLITSSSPQPDPHLHIGSAVRVFAVPIGLDRSGVLRNLRLASGLIRLAPQSDVVIATHTPTVPIVLVASRLLNRGRAVWLCQDYPEMFAGRPLQRWLYDHSSPLFDMVLCVSANGAAELPGARGADSSKVIVVGEGLSDAEILLPGDPARRCRHELLYVGDSRPRKGLMDLLAALALVRETETHASLAVASREDLRPKLEAESPVPFRFYHWPDRRALAALYARCAVFVSASWAEGFGLPPLEAMACGAPVVVTDSRGVREFARHEVNCLVVPPRDPAALATAILRLLMDRPLADRLGAAGVETSARYDWKSAADRFEEALRALVATSAGPAGVRGGGPS